jgi:hypothetical protein
VRVTIALLGAMAASNIESKSKRQVKTSRSRNYERQVRGPRAVIRGVKNIFLRVCKNRHGSCLNTIYFKIFAAQAFISKLLFSNLQMAPRKRASSDQIRDEAKRNVRPAKYKSISKRRPEGHIGSSRRSSPGLPPATFNNGSDDNSESRNHHLDLSSTDVDEENMEESVIDNGTKGKKKLSKDTRTMARSASSSSVITLVSWDPRLSCEEVKVDYLKHGPRPSQRALQPPGGFASSSGATQRHFPSSPGSLTERDVTDTDDNSADVQGIVGRELALLKHSEEVIYSLTLFRNPFPNVITLNTWVVEVWREAEEVLGDCEQSERSRGLVRVPNIFLGTVANYFDLVETVSFTNSFALRLGYQKGVSSIVQVGPAEGSRGTCGAGTVFIGIRPLSLPGGEL